MGRLGDDGVVERWLAVVRNEGACLNYILGTVDRTC